MWKNGFSKMEQSKSKEDKIVIIPNKQLSVSSRNRYRVYLTWICCLLWYLGKILAEFLFRPFSEHIAPEMVLLDNSSHSPRGLFKQQCLQKHTRLESKFAYNDSGACLGHRGAGELLCLRCPQHMVKWDRSALEAVQVGEAHASQH